MHTDFDLLHPGQASKHSARCMLIPHEAMLFVAVFTIAFLGTLWGSELAASSKTDTSNHPKRAQDVSLGADGILLLIQQSKTDPIPLSTRGNSVWIK